MQSTMYSTCKKLPLCRLSSTVEVAVVSKRYVPLGGAGGSSKSRTHTKNWSARVVTPSSPGLHLPCTSTPLAVVLMTYSSASSKSVS